MPDVVVFFRGNGDQCVREDYGSEAWDKVELQNQLDSIYRKMKTIETKQETNRWIEIDVTGKSIVDIADEVLGELVKLWVGHDNKRQENRPILKDLINGEFYDELTKLFNE